MIKFGLKDNLYLKKKKKFWFKLNVEMNKSSIVFAYIIFCMIAWYVNNKYMKKHWYFRLYNNI